MRENIMPRARSTKAYRQTAVSLQETDGSGCLSGFILPPLAVILFSTAFAFFIWRQPIMPVTNTSVVNNNQPVNNTATNPIDIQPVTSTTDVSSIFRAEVLHWADSISRWAAASNLDPNLLATVMQIESCGDPLAKSSAGAMGLFQVMPFHFNAADSPYAPDVNAARGAAYLAKSLQTAGGDARQALAGYNGGIGVINRGEWTWSSQTKRYVQYGWPIYQDARSGLTSSTALNEWYERYGANLCRQAHNRLGLQ